MSVYIFPLNGEKILVNVNTDTPLVKQLEKVCPDYVFFSHEGQISSTATVKSLCLPNSFMIDAFKRLDTPDEDVVDHLRDCGFDSSKFIHYEGGVAIATIEP
jgi:hypothetical protein